MKKDTIAAMVVFGGALALFAWFALRKKEPARPALTAVTGIRG